MAFMYFHRTFYLQLISTIFTMHKQTSMKTKNVSTSVLNLRRCTIPPLTVLYKASYMKQGYIISVFLLKYFFSSKFVISLCEIKLHDFSIGYRLRCALYVFENLYSSSIKTLSFYMITFHFITSKYIMHNLVLALHLFVIEFFTSELYKTFHTHCLI